MTPLRYVATRPQVASISDGLLLFSGLSAASQDSDSSRLVKSSSFSRSGTTTWASPVTEPAAASSGSSPSSPGTSSTSAANLNPRPLPKATGAVLNSGQVKGSTQKQGFDQSRLEPTLEEPPDSPCVTLLTSSCKRKLLFILPLLSG